MSRSYQPIRRDHAAFSTLSKQSSEDSKRKTEKKEIYIVLRNEVKEFFSRVKNNTRKYETKEMKALHPWLVRNDCFLLLDKNVG